MVQIIVQPKPASEDHLIEHGSPEHKNSRPPATQNVTPEKYYTFKTAGNRSTLGKRSTEIG
jgi:hypothetical protein